MFSSFGLKMIFFSVLFFLYMLVFFLPSCVHANPVKQDKSHHSPFGPPSPWRNDQLPTKRAVGAFYMFTRSKMEVQGHAVPTINFQRRPIAVDLFFYFLDVFTRSNRKSSRAPSYFSAEEYQRRDTGPWVVDASARFDLLFYLVTKLSPRGPLSLRFVTLHFFYFIYFVANIRSIFSYCVSFIMPRVSFLFALQLCKFSRITVWYILIAFIHVFNY